MVLSVCMCRGGVGSNIFVNMYCLRRMLAYLICSYTEDLQSLHYSLESFGQIPAIFVCTIYIHDTIEAAFERWWDVIFHRWWSSCEYVKMSFSSLKIHSKDSDLLISSLRYCVWIFSSCEHVGTLHVICNKKKRRSVQMRLFVFFLKRRLTIGVVIDISCYCKCIYVLHCRDGSWLKPVSARRAILMRFKLFSFHLFV